MTYSKSCIIINLCQKFDETIYHIISACPKLAKEQYIKRHDRVCAQLHFNICKETRVQLDKKHWYEHVPKSVETSQGGKVTILWDQLVQTIIIIIIIINLIYCIFKIIDYPESVIILPSSCRQVLNQCITLATSIFCSLSIRRPHKSLTVPHKVNVGPFPVPLYERSQVWRLGEGTSENGNMLPSNHKISHSD